MAKRGLAAKLGKAAEVRKNLKEGVETARTKVDKAIEAAPPPSPNPMTNLVIADIALRGGGRILRHLVETGVLKTKYDAGTARNIVKGRGMVQTLLGTAAARIATRSVPGAILVGGGLLAKALYDRKQGRQAERKGAQAVEEQAAKGESAES
jgi:hypothetical protein